MNNSIILRGIALAMGIAVLVGFRCMQTGSIRGTVSPAEGGVRVSAESPKDTLRAPIINGSYEIRNAKAGLYKIVVEARPPYQNATKDGIPVIDGQEADAGDIRLEK